MCVRDYFSHAHWSAITQLLVSYCAAIAQLLRRYNEWISSLPIDFAQSRAQVGGFDEISAVGVLIYCTE